MLKPLAYWLLTPYEFLLDFIKMCPVIPLFKIKKIIDNMQPIALMINKTNYVYVYSLNEFVIIIFQKA